MNSSKKSKSNTLYSAQLTSKWLAVSAWSTMVLGFLTIMLMGIFLPLSVMNMVAIVCVFFLVKFIVAKARERWILSEKLAQRAVELLSQTPESKKINVHKVMKKALANPIFMRDLRQCFMDSSWTVLANDVATGRWEIRLPDTWKDRNWHWCAFGFLTAARPYDVVCLNASRDGNHIILDISSPPGVFDSMLRWHHELTNALGIEPQAIVMNVDEFELIEPRSSKLNQEAQTPLQPWKHVVVLQPENVELTLSYDGVSYYANTRQGIDFQISEYKTWDSLWGTWHFFDEAVTILDTHKPS